jgi:CubicO group peptidase (beta-lactamase class C family)
MAGKKYPGPDSETNSNVNTITGSTDFVARITAEQLHAYYTKRHHLDGFNGAVIVAKDGQPIYTDAFGYSNISQKDTLTTQTPIQLASVTKTFTSSAILKLVDEQKLSLDDSLQKFFPDFPYKNMTVKLLLCHRTGLQDYVYWGRDFIGYGVDHLTNQSMLDLIVNKKPPLRAPPDRIFMYSNTNYALLALIIEKVSGMPYKQFMHDSIFIPLGMTNTFVCSIEDSASYCTAATCYQARRWQEWKMEFSDGVVGDKGIYSSAEDMLKWDNALRQGKVVSAEMMEEAYKPHSLDRYSFRDRTRNYGLGWRMVKQLDGSYLIYHNGNWHGCNNVFARNLKDGYTLIVLGNKSNEANYLTQPVWNIISKVRNSQNVAASMEE